MKINFPLYQRLVLAAFLAFHCMSLRAEKVWSIDADTGGNAILLREKRLAEWYNADSRGGLFVHWGLGTGSAPGTLTYPDVNAFDNATAAANWSPLPIVEAALKLNCKYIIWATLHVEHGLTRTWRSDIPGTPVTQRDYLGELSTAAATKGIKVVVYICGDAALQKEEVKAFIDSRRYASYKGKDIDIRNNNDHWVKYFAKDVMFEIMDRYPNVTGFWCDGWNSRSVDTITFAAIHKKNPKYLIFRNEYGNKPAYDDEDVMGIEPFAKILSPDFDKASGMYVQPGNGLEGSFVISADWWHIGTDFAADPKWSNKMTVTALGGSAIPCFGEGPTISGDFSPAVRRTNESIAQFFSYANMAVSNVCAGGYGKGGFKPGSIAGGGYITTTLSKDGNTHFIYVMKKPAGNTLVMPTVGYKITGVKQPGAGSLTYRIKNGELLINATHWSNLEKHGVEIFQITTSGRPGLVDRSDWTISTTNEIDSFPVSNVSDNDFDTYYSSDLTDSSPVEIVINTKSKKVIKGLLVNQYEGRALTSARYYPINEGTRIKDYEVYTSDDNMMWDSCINAGTLENERGVKYIRLNQGTRKRFIKLKILNNYKGNTIVQICDLNALK